MSRAIVHGVFVALAVVVAVEVPDPGARPDPDWLVQLCADFDDFCDSAPRR